MPPIIIFFPLFSNIIINLKVYTQYLNTNLRASQVSMLAKKKKNPHNIKGDKFGEEGSSHRHDFFQFNIRDQITRF
jgi:hypothetical protein